MATRTMEPDFESGGGIDEDRIIRLLAGGKALRRRRLRRLAIAHLLRERGEEGEDEEGFGAEEGGGEIDERRIARALVAGGMIRRKRLRRLMLAHLLREGEGEGGGGWSGISEEDEEEPDVDERQLVRLLVGGGIARRRRLRRLVVAHLIREGRGEEGPEMEGEDEEEGGGDEERQLVRFLIGRGIARRRRARRGLAMAHLIRQGRSEWAGDEDEEGEEEEGGGIEPQLVKLLIGRNVMRRRRLRRAVLAHMARESEEA